MNDLKNDSDRENGLNKYNRNTQAITLSDLDQLHLDIKEDDRKRDKFKEKIITKKEEVGEIKKDIKNKIKSSSPPSSNNNFNFILPKVPSDINATKITPSLDDKLQLQRENNDLKEKVSRYEENIKKLKHENQQLRLTIANQNSESSEGDDYDRKRREAELSAVKDKLQHEISFRKDLQRQLNDVKEELKNLKLSLHSVQKIPSINSTSSHLSTLSNPQFFSNNNNNNNNNNIIIIIIITTTTIIIIKEMKNKKC